MCSKNIHTLKEWRDEMLRLKKQAGHKFETDPDYVKTAQCKESILSKEGCGKFERPTKAPTPKAPKANTTRKKTDAYDAYKYDLKGYELNMRILKGLYKNLGVFKKKIDSLEKKLNKLNTEEERNLKKKADLEEKLKKEVTKTQLETYTKRIQECEESNQKIVQEIMQLQHQSNMEYKHYDETLDHISKYERKTDKPVPPESFECVKKNCPKGYLRNKTTRRCDRH
jgi:DNA repair exonuclease SbcCD ATPase subunit